jgi:5-methylcytosine-specific restriction endonuclease McrA
MDFTCCRCGYKATTKGNYIRHLTAKKTCEAKHSNEDRESLIKKAVKKNRVGDTILCEFCNKEICKSHKARHITKCKGKAKVDKILVSKSTHVINTKINVSLDINERLKNLEQQVTKLQYLEEENIGLKEIVSRQMQCTNGDMKGNEIITNERKSQDDTTEVGTQVVETGRKRNKLNKQMRARCWNAYVGDDVGKTKCLCCKEQTITTFTFECGHVIAHAEGGSNGLSNLRPICRECNNGMGTQHMKKYAKETFGVDME